MRAATRWAAAALALAVLIPFLGANAAAKEPVFSLDTQTVAVESKGFRDNTLKTDTSGFTNENWERKSCVTFHEDEQGRLYALSKEEKRLTSGYAYRDVVRLSLVPLDGKSPVRSVELPEDYMKWGGAYYAPDGFFYVAVGHNNDEQQDSKKVYTILKYDENGKLCGRADITGGESLTTYPYSSGSCDFAYSGGQLIVHTSRTRYKDEQGVKHQSNMTIKLDTKTMRVLECSNDFPNNHVGHSFAQRVRFDGSKAVYVDHGDAYPRALVLQVDPLPDVQAPRYQYLDHLELISFPGKVGDNYTGLSLGGLEVGKDGYLITGKSVPNSNAVKGVTGSDSSLKRNVFLCTAPRGGTSSSFRWITNYDPKGNEEAGTPILLKLTDNRFALFYEKARDGKHLATFCMLLDSSGKTLAYEQLGARLPNWPETGMSVLDDGRVVWAVTGQTGKTQVHTLTIRL